MAEQRTKTTTQKRASKTSAKAAPARASKPTTKTTKKAVKKTASASTASRTAPAKKAVAKKVAAPATPRRARPARPETQVGPSDEARELALAAASAGLEKKAVGVEILDVLGKVDYTDYLVLMTGRSDRHVDSIAQGIMEELDRKMGKRALSVEGLQAANWVLIDFGDIVVHVFQEEARETYDIAGLWLDAARLPLPEGAGED